MAKSVGDNTMRLAHHLQRHPSGMWHFCPTVPSDLRPIVGLRYIKKSLRTRDLTLARWWAWLLDETRSRRSTARQRLDQWEAAHPLKMWAAKASGREDGKPAEWRALHQEAAVLDCRVQEIKGTLRRHREYLDAFDQEAQVLKGQEAEQKERLGRSMGSVQTLNPSLVDTLMSVVQEGERMWMEEGKPVAALPSLVQVEEISPPQLRLANRSRLVPHP